MANPPTTASLAAALVFALFAGETQRCSAQALLAPPEKTRSQPAMAAPELVPISADQRSNPTYVTPRPVIGDIAPVQPPAQEPSTGRSWVRAEYLGWWIRGANAPPLVTVSPPGTPLFQAGVIGAPGTQVVFGDGPIDTGLRCGLRVAAGCYLDRHQDCALEVSFFWLGSPHGSSFSAGSADGSAIVGRPFTDAGTGLPTAELVSFPGALAGFVEVNSSSSLLGVNPLIRKQLCPCHDPCCEFLSCWNFEALAGYRYLNFRDRLQITEDLAPMSPRIVPGTSIFVRDEFETCNQFHGLTLGLAAERAWQRCFFAVDAKVNLGAIIRRVSIDGQTVVQVPGDVTQVSQGGLLALSSNIGAYRSCQFAAVPELDLRVGCQLTPRLRGFVGYSLLVMPHVARAAEQIDPVVNPFLLPPPEPNAGPARPRFPGNSSTLWAQGFTVGLELRW